ncbi:hypothetical protein AB0E77_08550 [Streptomyces sp. NPDC032940]|uniref:hypothetical protein n=1 Tax=Streptomyces sp. NPDC032940 TaxID=3155366 RepID=UPI0034015AE4
MRALPARPIALGALCAALLAGITGPVALAADHNPGHTRAASSDTPLPAPEKLLGEVKNLDARGAELAPVADLLSAVVASGDRALPPAEAKELGEAAKDALDKAAAKAAATEAATRTPATDRLAPASGADLIGDALDAVQKAVDDLLGSILATNPTDTADTADASGTADTSGTADAADATDVTTPSLDQLLAEVSKLVDALTVGDPTVSTLPAPATPPATTPSATTPSTLPALTPPAPVLLPAS